MLFWFLVATVPYRGRGPEFGRSFNPIQTRWADYAPHTTASLPRFKKLSTPLPYVNDAAFLNFSLNENKAQALLKSHVYFNNFSRQFL